MRRKDMADGAVLNCLWWAIANGAWLTAITYILNDTELSREEFQENIFLRYGKVPFNLPTDCDGFGERLSVLHALAYPNGGLILARHNDAAM